MPWVKEPHRGETSRTQVGQSPPTTGTQHIHWRGTAAQTVIILPPTACPGQSCATTSSPPPIQIPFCDQKNSREQHKKPTLQAKTPLFPLRPAMYPSSYQPQYKLSAKPAWLATRVCSAGWDLARHLSARDTKKAALWLFSATTAAMSMQLWETVE